MNQWQYDTICKIIREGTPILANDLCGALANLVNERNSLIEENANLKSLLESRDCEEADPPEMSE